LSWALVFVGVLFVVFPATDWILTNLPLEVSRLTWRYQALGRLSQALITPLFGVALIVGVSSFAGRGWVARLGGLLSFAASLGLLMLLAVFIFDMADARAQVRDEAAQIFRIGAIRAILKFSLSSVAFALLGWAGFAIAREAADDSTETVRGSDDGVVFKAT
jgi:hypothetical protein